MSVNAENFSEFPKIVKRFSSALKGISLFPYLRFIVGIKEIYHYPKQPQKVQKEEMEHAFTRKERGLTRINQSKIKS